MKIDRPIIFFDGNCIICSNFVDFVINNQAKDHSLFIASLQGQTAKSILPLHFLEKKESVLFYGTKNEIDEKFFAIINILKRLKFPYYFVGFLFSILPIKLLNIIYDFFSVKRSLFLNSRCRTPSEIERSYFLP